MRVMILNYEYPPLGGGAGVATEALGRGLASRGAAVDIVTAGTESSQATEMLWDGESAEEGLLTVHRVKAQRTATHQAGMRDAWSYLTAALPVVRRLLGTEAYDVVHCFFALPTGALLPLLNLQSTPVIVSLLGSDVPGYDPHNRSLQRVHRVLLPLTRWIWRRADRVVALSESLGRQASLTLPGLRYSIVHNGVDTTRFHPPSRRRPPAAGPIRCLAVARLVERKGLTDLIDAIASLERGRFTLEIVGGGPDEESLRQRVARHGLLDQVHFSGALEQAEVAVRYREADIFTLASWEESFGNVFAEALASGLPIVGSATGGIPEFVQDGENGLLVPPRNPVALAAAIKRLADDPSLRLHMARANRSKAELTLSWEGVTSRYQRIYQGVQRRAPARPLITEVASSTW